MILSGHAARFGEWTTISSVREGGPFREMVAAGAFKKTVAENGARVRVLLSHGQDPQLGDKPLGPLEELREDAHGLWYSARLLDGVPALVLSGLREPNLWGSSFRFATIREEFTQHPGRSPHNQDGIPERVLKEVRLHELGPTPWPAYQGATASARAAGDAIELRALAGRVEVIPVALAHGDAPVTLRRLRAEGGTRARALLRSLGAGATVEIVWGARGRSLGRVLEQRRRDYRIHRSPTRASWRL